jgi:hypothetical protein
MGATIERISEFMAKLGESLAGIQGVGYWLFLAGFTILVLVVAVLFLRILIVAIREIPNMTVKQFIKFMLALSIVLMAVAIFL